MFNIILKMVYELSFSLFISQIDFSSNNEFIIYNSG